MGSGESGFPNLCFICVHPWPKIPMSIGLTIEVKSAELEAKLDRFFNALSRREELNRNLGRRGRELTRNHLTAIAQTRHATAQKLGASPSGHWGQAAEKTSFTADEAGATVTVKQQGIGRVAHDVDITPGAGKKYLTIPAIAEAYNQRAYRLDLDVMIRRKDGAARAVALGKPSGKGKEKTFTVWYWLVKSVHQKQDRTLLPSDEEYRLTTLAGVRDYIDFVLS